MIERPLNEFPHKVQQTFSEIQNARGCAVGMVGRSAESNRALRDGFILHRFPGTTCQATFMTSLWDKSCL
jgi:hypothetical protein